MAYSDLREWISALDKAGELKRIKAEVDPILEITEITDRVSKWPARGHRGPGGPALLFENVKGHPGAKVLINQFGSERRMKLALEVESLDETSARIKMFMEVKSPQGLLDKIKMLPMLADGRWPVYHPAVGHHPRSEVRQAQRRHLSPARV